MMVDYLRKSFGERINQMDWLSDFSKRSSIEKLNAITAHSAYPEELFDPGYVSQFYSSVSKIIILMSCRIIFIMHAVEVYYTHTKIITLLPPCA